MAYGNAAGAADRVKVFVSYSRADTPFALDLVAALQACGFEAYIDQEDIAPGEAWEQRLSGLIAGADTVVYVLSPESLTSDNCIWEVEETQRLNKRLLPVVFREIDDTAVPQDMAALNYTFFTGKNSFAGGLKDLSAALRVDHQWIREHTRLGALARRWDKRGRTDELLLRGSELDAASEWMAARPQSAPEISDDQLALISASQEAREAADRAARTQRRKLVLLANAVSLVFAALGGYAILQSRDANAARVVAEDANAALSASLEDVAAAKQEIEGVNLRLSADIALLAPPTGDRPFSTYGGWFPVAANYSGAVMRLQKGRQIITGMLIDGALIHPDYAGKSLVLTPRFFKSEAQLIEEDRRLDEFLRATDQDGEAGAESMEGSSMTRSLVAPDPAAEFEGEAFSKINLLEVPEESGSLDDMEQRYLTDEELGIPDNEDGTPAPIHADFPTLGDGAKLTLAETALWHTPEHLAAEQKFSVYEFTGEVPFGARAISATDIDCEFHTDASAGGAPYALFGIGASGPGATRSLSPESIPESALGAVCPDGNCELNQQLTLLVTEGLDFYEIRPMTYRHATLKGAFGAPVFDLETGKIIGIHQGVIASQLGPNGRIGYAEPLLPLLDRIRDGHSVDRSDEDRTPPVCG